MIRLSPGRGRSSSKSSRTDAKVNCLVIRYLYFWSVRGDLQEGNGCSSRCQSLSFRAQNWGFCAFFAFGTPVFRVFEHKIEVFVRFCPPKPPFSGISSTKSRFLCVFSLRNPRFLASRAQKWGFCALWMWNGAQVLAVTIVVAVALTVAKVLALTTILAAVLA